MSTISPYRPPNPKLMLELAPLVPGGKGKAEWQALADLGGGHAFAEAANMKGLDTARKREFRAAADAYYAVAARLALSFESGRG